MCPGSLHSLFSFYLAGSSSRTSNVTCTEGPILTTPSNDGLITLLTLLWPSEYLFCGPFYTLSLFVDLSLCLFSVYLF